MIQIQQRDDKKEKSQSYECTFSDMEIPTHHFGYGKNTKDSVDDFKEGIMSWKKELDDSFENIDFDKLYKYDGKERVIHKF